MLNTERILRLIKNAGYTEYAVCKALKWGNGVISKWENHSPSIDKLTALSNFISVPISTLLEYTDDHTYTNEQDDEVWELRREMAERPEMKTLFSLAKTADKDTINFANEMIMRMRKDSGYSDE